MLFQVFCKEHFEEAFKHIKKKHPDHDVGYSESFKPDEFDDTESDQEFLKDYKCDYPECEEYPYREILWMEPFTGAELSSAYVPLEELEKDET